VLFFAVFQAPQEAVMWIAAVGEEFQLLFALA
jgi:thiamine monophosphate kinase